MQEGKNPTSAIPVLSFSVIPGLTRNPEKIDWMPAFAGMTENEELGMTEEKN